MRSRMSWITGCLRWLHAITASPPRSSPRRCPLRRGVQGEIVGVRSEPVTEHAVADRLRAVRAPHVQIRARIVHEQTPVLVPLRLPDPQDEPHRLECRHVCGLVARVDDGQVDVDHGLGGETRDPGRPDVLQSADPVSEGVMKPISSFVATPVHLPFGGRDPMASHLAPAARPQSSRSRSTKVGASRSGRIAGRRLRMVSTAASTRWARSERVPADRLAEFELPPRRPARRPQGDGRRRRVPAGDLGLQHQVGPVGPAPRPIEEQRQQLGRDPERWVRHDAVRLLRGREPTNVGLDHPHPNARPDGSKTITQPAGPYRIGFDRPEAYAGRDDRTRQRAGACTDLDDEFTRFESERVDESPDQSGISEEVLTERAASLVAPGPALSPGHGPSPSTS